MWKVSSILIYKDFIAAIKYYNIQNDWHDWNLVRVEIVFYCQKMKNSNMSYKYTATQVNTMLHSHFYLHKVKYFKNILQEKKTFLIVNWLDDKKGTLQHIVVWSQVWIHARFLKKKVNKYLKIHFKNVPQCNWGQAQHLSWHFLYVASVMLYASIRSNPIILLNILLLGI